MSYKIVRYVTPSHLLNLMHTLRPKQWIKNGFVAAPLLFSGEFLNLHAITKTLIAIGLFCLAASLVYLFNDLHDLNNDRQHPLKIKSRPFASGVVSVTEGWVLIGILFCSIAYFGLYVPGLLGIVSAYIVLNVAYTLNLKNQPVLDLFCIALGFVLRVYAGATALTLPVSNWMFITTLCLALYLAATKRRQEYLQHGSTSRPVLMHYSLPLLDYYAHMSATGALIFYSMFVMSSKPRLVLTIPLVLFGLFRYAYLVQTQAQGESPTDVLLSDWPLLATVCIWALTCSALLLISTPTV